MSVKDLKDLKKLSMLRSQINCIPLNKLMSESFPIVLLDDRISDVLSKMRNTNYQDIPVINNGEYIGVVSYISILKKKNINLDAKVKSIIYNPPTVSSDTEITKIAEIMISSDCRQIPVVTGKKIVGIIDRNKLIEVSNDIKALNEIKVWEIMSDIVDVARPNDVMDDVLDLMIREDYRTVPVVNESNNVIGIIGMMEIINNNWKKENKTIGDLEKSSRSQILIQSIATTNVKTISWDSNLLSAVDMMAQNHFSSLPVIEKGNLIGIITEYDILELISACRERDMLFIQISGLDDADKVLADSLYKNIEPMVAKVSKIYKPESLMIHVSKYNDKGNKCKYSIGARMFINGTAIVMKETGWDFMKTSLDLISKMEDSIINMKDSKVTFRKSSR